MQNVRGKLVNFRVSDAEFALLKTASDRHGARCLSAFARKMVLSTFNADGENVADQLVDLDRRLTILENSMARVFQALTNSNINFNATQS